MATQDDYIRTALRVPPELHTKIHESARENNRTFNAEIVARLEASFSSQTEPGGALTALAMRLAQAENELALSKMESQLHLLDANFAASAAVAAADFNSQLGHPHPFDKKDWEEVVSIHQQTTKAIESTSEDQFQALMDQADAAQKRLKENESSLTHSKRQSLLKISTDH